MDLRCPGQPRSQALSNGESDWEQGCAHDIIVIRLWIEQCESKDQQSLLKAWHLPSSFFSSLIWVTLCTVWIQRQLINLKFQLQISLPGITDRLIYPYVEGRALSDNFLGGYMSCYTNTRPCFIYSITHNYICGLDTKLQTYYFPDPDCSKGG